MGELRRPEPADPSVRYRKIVTRLWGDERFQGLSRIDQHKLVYDVFGPEIGGPIHALSLKTSTPGGPQ